MTSKVGEHDFFNIINISSQDKEIGQVGNAEGVAEFTQTVKGGETYGLGSPHRTVEPSRC